jgi:hypothetical protein
VAEPIRADSTCHATVTITKIAAGHLLGRLLVRPNLGGRRGPPLDRRPAQRKYTGVAVRNLAARFLGASVLEERLFGHGCKRLGDHEL